MLLCASKQGRVRIFVNDCVYLCICTAFKLIYFKLASIKIFQVQHRSSYITCYLTPSVEVLFDCIFEKEGTNLYAVLIVYFYPFTHFSKCFLEVFMNRKVASPANVSLLNDINLACQKFEKGHDGIKKMTYF